jgi:hypothetical protein
MQSSILASAAQAPSSATKLMRSPMGANALVRTYAEADCCEFTEYFGI